MPALPAMNQAYLLESLVELLQTPSPTGYTKLVTSRWPRAA